MGRPRDASPLGRTAGAALLTLVALGIFALRLQSESGRRTRPSRSDAGKTSVPSASLPPPLPVMQVSDPDHPACPASFQVSGIVLDEVDRPVFDAQVRLAGEADDGELGATRTSWHGAFELRVAGPERECQLAVVAALVFRSTSGARVALVGGQATTPIHPGPARSGASIGIVRIRWTRPIYSIQGVGLDSVGQPVPTIAVQSRGDFRITQVCGNEFQVLALAPTPIPIWIESKGFAPTLLEGTPVLRGGHAMVQLDRGSALHGSVIDEVGRPVENASVLLGFAAGGISFRQAMTNSSGTFEFDGLPETPISPSLTVNHSGFRSRSWETQGKRVAEIGDIRIQLERTSSPAVVRIVVSGQDAGEPVDEPLIGFMPSDPERDPVTVFAKDEIQLPPGSYEVEARVPGRALYSRTVVFAEGPNTLIVKFVPGGRISGRVSDSGGLVVEGAVVRALQPEKAGHQVLIDCSESDSMGRFELDHMPGGWVELTAEKRGWKRATAAVEVRAQEHKTCALELEAER